MKPRILFVDDDDTFRSVLHRELVSFGYDVTSVADAELALQHLHHNRVETALVDLRLPGLDGLGFLQTIKERDPHLPVILLTGHGSFPDAVAAMRAGAFDFLTKPAALEELDIALKRAVEHGTLRRQNRLLRKLITRRVAPEILGESEAIQQLRSSIERIGPSEAHVLIQGESGTGKELVARAIHAASSRRESAFVVVNCPAIPADLFESELFGHTKGAFTGAGQERLGLIALAEGGTLFLDEIGELPLHLQPSLLRAVQFGEYRPVGGDKNEYSDVRILAATNRELLNSITLGEFREDLYHRIAPLTLDVPPLRAREDDAVLIAKVLLDAHNGTAHAGQTKVLTEGALEKLRDHSWSGNVRELENAMVRLATLVEGEEIEASDVAAHVLSTAPRIVEDLPSLNLEVLERIAIVHALRRHAGHRGRAAAELGVAVKTLYNRILHHGVTAPEWDAVDKMAR
ncbi:MAG TPA: sigma-54-dependent Fis family transcriptional regulator [Planctomycetes bacterium]|nr:sigma-54-dependent Fis family transcriptional regulator [Planctomycetota bacterium]HIK61070.1 sigma-54-dependent Fis family transcriptional regulator [Planctomycetota bacterium]